MEESKKIRFSVFVIHQLAEKWHKLPTEVYAILDRTGILDNYIIKHYDTLHTLGMEYLTEDISEYVEEEGVRL